MITNCLSIDVECFVESNLQSFQIDDKYISNTKAAYELEKNIDFILSFFNEHHVKGTFFFLGRIAKDHPKIVAETETVPSE